MSRKFYIKAITVNKKVLKQTQSLAVLCCQNIDMSSYRIAWGRNVSFADTQSLPIFVSKHSKLRSGKKERKLLERVHAIKDTTKYIIATFSFTNSDTA